MSEHDRTPSLGDDHQPQTRPNRQPTRLTPDAAKTTPYTAILTPTIPGVNRTVDIVRSVATLSRSTIHGYIAPEQKGPIRGGTGGGSCGWHNDRLTGLDPARTRRFPADPRVVSETFPADTVDKVREPNRDNRHVCRPVRAVESAAHKNVRRRTTAARRCARSRRIGVTLKPVSTSTKGRSGSPPVDSCVVELDRHLDSAARMNLSAIQSSVTARCGDASDPSLVSDMLPADLLLLVGMFGNVSDTDVHGSSRPFR